MQHEATLFGANLVGWVNLVDSRFVVNPKENFTGGRLKVEKGAKMKKKSQDSGGSK
jgi:hypothetical protein